MPKIVSCHCKLTCKSISTTEGKRFFKCGEEINLKGGKTGCNFFMTEEESKQFQEKRKLVRQHFKSFSKFPRCRHNLRAKVRVATEKSRNPGRPFFCCNVRLPDSSCKFFHWADQPCYQSTKDPQQKGKQSDEDSSDEDFAQWSTKSNNRTLNVDIVMLTLLIRLYYIIEELVYGPHWIRDVERCLQQQSTKQSDQGQRTQEWVILSLFCSSCSLIQKGSTGYLSAVVWKQ